MRQSLTLDWSREDFRSLRGLLIPLKEEQSGGGMLGHKTTLQPEPNGQFGVFVTGDFLASWRG